MQLQKIITVNISLFKLDFHRGNCQWNNQRVSIRLIEFSCHKHDQMAASVHSGAHSSDPRAFGQSLSLSISISSSSSRLLSLGDDDDFILITPLAGEKSSTVEIV